MAYQATEKCWCSKSNIATMAMTRRTRILVLALTLISASLIPGALPLPLSETQALIVFKTSIYDDPYNELATWDETQANPCSWKHITCNDDSKVVQLVLSNTLIAGQLAPEFGLLSELRLMILDWNALSGPIPPEFGNLRHLTTLNLAHNGLSGSIPPSLGNLQKLNTLGLQHNQLTGKIPSQIATIKSLRIATFNDNTDLCWDFWATPPVFRGFYRACPS